VIGVASGRHEAFLADLGVDEFIDYTTTSVTDIGRVVDIVVDTVGGPEGYRFLDVIKKGGTLCPVFFGDYRFDQLEELGIVLNVGQVHSDGAQMAALAELIDAGRVIVGIDGVFSLADAPRAHRRAEQGHIQGKIVLVNR
jgi:NADPH:quinone reductase-like Zn-dependent oxidoreductase